MNWHIFDAKAKSLRCKSLSMTTFGDRLSNCDIVRGIPILYSLMAFSILRFLHIVENFSDEADELLLSNAQWVKSMYQKYISFLFDHSSLCQKIFVVFLGNLRHQNFILTSMFGFKAPEVPFYGITSPYSYFEVI